MSENVGVTMQGLDKDTGNSEVNGTTQFVNLLFNFG